MADSHVSWSTAQADGLTGSEPLLRDDRGGLKRLL